jgi:hypothetical protein
MMNAVYPAARARKSRSTTPEKNAPDEILAFNQRGLFIGGCPKSGTTLLLALLDSHPELVVLPEETHFFDQGKHFAALDNFPAKLSRLLGKSSLQLLGQGRIEPLREASGADVRDYTGFPYERFTQLAHNFISQPEMNDSRLLSETVRAYAIAKGFDWRNCVRWVEKTTSNEVFADDLFRLFPEAKLLQIVRDPRAVFASRKRRLMNRYGRHAKAHRLVREWNSSVRQVSRLRHRPANYLVVRYEDLVLHPREIIEQICRFVGIRFLPELLQPTRAGAQWQGNSSFHDAFTGVEAQSVDQWKNELSPREIWWIESHCRAGMQLAGYQPQTNGKFSLLKWCRRLPGESLGGYFRSRRGSLSQIAGLLEDCRYEKNPASSLSATRQIEAFPEGILPQG